MEFSKRLKALRYQAGLTQKELGEEMNVSAMTVRNWEAGSKSPSMSAIISLAGTLNVSSDYLLGISPPAEDDRSDAPLDKNEAALLSAYRRLDKYGRKTVETVCRLEKSRIDDMRTDERRVFPMNGYTEQTAVRYIPKYITPSAAGFSVPLDGDDFTMIPADENVPADADFAVAIQGDSMSPYICDGDTVYVKRDAQLSNGDVGIFSVDGAMYCKIYYKDKNNNVILASANPSLKHTDVFVGTDRGSDLECFGKVLLDFKVHVPRRYEDEKHGG